MASVFPAKYNFAIQVRSQVQLGNEGESATWNEGERMQSVRLPTVLMACIRSGGGCKLLADMRFVDRPVYT